MKEELIEQLRAEHDEWQAAVSAVPAEDLDLPGASGEWSVRDLLAQMMGYEEYTADRLAEIQQGRPYRPATSQEELAAFQDAFGYPDFGSALLDDAAFERWMAASYQGWPLPDLLTRERWVFAGLLHAIESLPADAPPSLFQWVGEQILQTYQRQKAALRRWLG